MREPAMIGWLRNETLYGAEAAKMAANWHRLPVEFCTLPGLIAWRPGKPLVARGADPEARDLLLVSPPVDEGGFFTQLYANPKDLVDEFPDLWGGVGGTFGSLASGGPASWVFRDGPEHRKVAEVLEATLRSYDLLFGLDRAQGGIFVKEITAV
jgi:hypothetical protein